MISFQVSYIDLYIYYQDRVPGNYSCKVIPAGGLNAGGIYMSNEHTGNYIDILDDNKENAYKVYSSQYINLHLTCVADDNLNI